MCVFIFKCKGVGASVPFRRLMTLDLIYQAGYINHFWFIYARNLVFLKISHFRLNFLTRAPNRVVIFTHKKTNKYTWFDFASCHLICDVLLLRLCTGYVVTLKTFK